MKGQTRNTEVQLKEEEIGKLPGKEFSIMIVKMIKNLENKMEKIKNQWKKDLEELKNKHEETNNTTTEIKNTLEGINCKISEAGEQSIELDDKMVGITSEEQNKVKRMKRKYNSLRDLSDSIKCTNMWIIGVAEEEEKKKRYEKSFEKIIVEIFHNMQKEIVNQIQEEQRVL